ncbi:uncharacterized protein LOC134258382 [Saccostrea cucullata]|uniref:uncharacterized protein LOC134258382 n=1 Tax=Saccostrea cuccullata TaxID=36930 RepID=UPI002ED12932
MKEVVVVLLTLFITTQVYGEILLSDKTYVNGVLVADKKVPEVRKRNYQRVWVDEAVSVMSMGEIPKPLYVGNAIVMQSHDYKNGAFFPIGPKKSFKAFYFRNQQPIPRSVMAKYELL